MTDGNFCVSLPEWKPAHPVVLAFRMARTVWRSAPRKTLRAWLVLHLYVAPVFAFYTWRIRRNLARVLG